MRIVLDTNIYLSGLIFPESFPGQVLKLAKMRKITVYCSKFIVDEIKRNLTVKFGYSDAMAEKFIDEILKFVKIIKTRTKVLVIKDKVDDNRILECAIAAKADFLVSGDKKHILRLKKYKGTKIVSPKEFIMLNERFKGRL